MYELRPYQEDLIERIVESMKLGHKRIIVQSPPRTGKTVVMAEIARKTTANKNDVMFLIHRKEVLDQAKATFMEQGVNPNFLNAGMVQTLTRRVNFIKPPKLILIDEAHHVLAKSYQRILDKFPDAFVLMFTATPIRTGRMQMDQVADDLIVGMSIHKLTKAGFLAPFRYFLPPGDFDEKALKRSSTGDYTTESMQEAMSTKIFGHIVKQYKRIASGMQAVVYTYSVDSAIKVAAEFNEAGISAKEVDGTTPPDIRDKAVQDFRNKKLKILVNVNLFTEGVDLPDVDCVIMARPTMSLALYLQFSMRCLNPREGKTAIIIDHANNFKKFGYPDDDRDWRAAIKTTRKTKRKTMNIGEGMQITTCDYCFAVVKASEVKDGKCPICGKPLKVKKLEAKVKDVDLVEARRKREKTINKIIKDNLMKEIAGKTIGELNTFKELLAYAQLHNYKPGWAYFMAKKKGIIK